MLQRNRLGQGARESVEDEASGAMQALTPLANQVPDRGIGHEFAAAHEAERFLHRRALLGVAPARRRTKNIPRRKMTGVEVLVQQVSLGTFADARSAQK